LKIAAIVSVTGRDKMILTSALLKTLGEAPPDFDGLDAPAATERVSLVNLLANSCRWPSSDPREPDFGFCGKPKLQGAPYCAEHAALAYERTG
jgi:hypothetical protein